MRNPGGSRPGSLRPSAQDELDADPRSKTVSLPSEDEHDRLSAREREVLGLAAEGFLDKQIGPRLQISENTLKTYWRRIRSKLGELPRSKLVSAYVLCEFEKERLADGIPIQDPLPDWVVDIPGWTWKRLTDRKLPIEMDIGVEFDLDQILDNIHPEDQPEMRAILGLVIDGSIDDFIYRMRFSTADGVKPGGAFVRVVRDGEGKALQLFGHHCRLIYDIDRGEMKL